MSENHPESLWRRSATRYKEDKTMRVPYQTMLAEFERVLSQYGFSAGRAHDAAEIFAQNSLAGVFSHGLNRFPVVVNYLKKGEIDPAA